MVPPSLCHRVIALVAQLNADSGAVINKDLDRLQIRGSDSTDDARDLLSDTDGQRTQVGPDPLDYVLRYSARD